MGESQVTADYVTPALLKWRRWTDLPLIVLAIGSLPLLLLELQPHKLSDDDKLFLGIVNVVILIAFAVDYFVELRLASNKASYARHEWSSLLIVIAQGLAIAPLPAFRSFGILRAARAARPLRTAAVIIRVVSIGGAAASEGRSTLRRHAATFALAIAGLVWITSAVAFTLAERVGPGEDYRVHDFFDGLWWSAATITTVGYGDVYPISFVGRCVGMLTMVVGISTFAIVTAKVAEFLVRADIEAERSDVPTSM